MSATFETLPPQMQQEVCLVTKLSRYQALLGNACLPSSAWRVGEKGRTSRRDGEGKQSLPGRRSQAELGNEG